MSFSPFPVFVGLVAGLVLGSTAAAAPAGPIPVQAKVVSASPEQFLLEVETGPLPSFGLAAGVRSVSVNRGDALVFAPGDAIRGQLAPYGEGGLRLERVYRDDPNADRVVDEIARRLRRDTVERGPGNFRREGEFVPDFALYDHTGRVVRPAQWRGQRLMINFIFTRCRVPTMCPASTARMVEVQKALLERGITDVQQVTVSFDPDYDTPGILRQYAEEKGIDVTQRFSLLTGPKGAIDDLMQQFGILRRYEDGTIDHTMATLLVGPDGRITFRREGSRWTVAEFLDRLAPPPAQP